MRMKTVCEPANSLEGHMLQDILRQRGIESRLDGAGLQGAVGELPAIGLVRLLVAEEDYSAARAVMDEWEKTQIADPIRDTPRTRPGAFLGGLIGVVLGVAGAYLYFRVPMNTQGIDYNGDGILDERWNNSPSGVAISSEIDRNLDRILDIRWRFDSDGFLESGESDDDFDGTFESRTRYRNGQPYLTTTETGENSSVNLRYLYRNGIVTRIEYIDKDSGEPLRIEDYMPGKLVSADVDTDRDGRLDRRYLYDDLNNISSTEEITAPQ